MIFRQGHVYFQQYKVFLPSLTRCIFNNSELLLIIPKTSLKLHGYKIQITYIRYKS